MNDTIKIVFAGGGTGGHIYPGLAVAASFKAICKKNKIDTTIYWIGNSKGMDKNIVEKDGTADFFYGISSGKLRRYFSIKNFFDIFKIFFGFVQSFFILKKIKPDILFSKGGFVSVPPCFAARMLHIKVFTHECDFTPGLATKINSKSAEKILLSYEETKSFFSASMQNKLIVTGNPVRPVFYEASSERGLEFLGIKNEKKPILLVLGGSLGSKQINELVAENLEWLCERFFVVHQGVKEGVAGNFPLEGVAENASLRRGEGFPLPKNYKSYPFIYEEMPCVIKACDVVLSRAGANSLWECAVLGKPLVLIPLSGSGTRGDQEDNAAFFEKIGGAVVLARENATSENLKNALEKMANENERQKCTENLKKLTNGEKPSEKIAELLYNNQLGS